MDGPEGHECDRCHWINIHGLDPGAVIAAIWNAKRRDFIALGFSQPMPPEDGRAWYNDAEWSGGSFEGFKRLDYVHFVAFKAFINEDWLEASMIAKSDSDDVIAVMRAIPSP